MHPIHHSFHHGFPGRNHRHAGRLTGWAWHAAPAGPRGGHGGHGDRHDAEGRDGFGRHGGGHRRGGRMFEQGAIKLLALSLIAERPCHGYDIIKFIEGLVGGDYSPSPGVIYPTLAYLVDMGWAAVADSDAGRKQYSITPEGLAQLERQQADLTALKERLRLVREGAGARRSPDIERAMGNLKAVLQVRFSHEAADASLARRVAALIDEAALAIQKLEG
ncbi:MAG: PadR family transcriptional regulator [Pelomonas sp.]|nr:PadR family transcriptional regulator [Roseateles sp.]